MSNYLAIATVTAALQQLLQTEVGQEVPGVQVTTARPDVPTNIAGACINIFLYQATPNPAWRNADVRTRRPRGDLTKHSLAALDLHYLLTFYGNDQEFEPQRLMGSAVRTLADQPLLTHDMIEDSLGDGVLTDSTLLEQTQLVKFVPSSITTEDLSRIWSIFFQVPYSLSFAYQATAVMIQGKKAGDVALPVSQRATAVRLGRPVLLRIEHHPPEDDPADDSSLDNADFDSPDFDLSPEEQRQRREAMEEQRKKRSKTRERGRNTITLASRLTIHGRDFNSGASDDGVLMVQIGRARLTPTAVNDRQVELDFAALPPAEVEQLRAGNPGLQVIRVKPSRPDGDLDAGVIESNLLPLVLCPRILDVGDVTVQNLRDDGDGCYSGTVQIDLDLAAQGRQRVFILMNGTTGENAVTYIFRAERLRSPSRQLRFPIQEVQAGEYLLRVQIDGAETPLMVGDRNQYTGPLLVIA